MKPGEIRTADEWDAYEGARWLEAVAERGLKLARLAEDEQWMVERAESRNRAIVRAGVC